MKNYKFYRLIGFILVFISIIGSGLNKTEASVSNFKSEGPLTFTYNGTQGYVNGDMTSRSLLNDNELTLDNFSWFSISITNNTPTNTKALMIEEYVNGFNAGSCPNSCFANLNKGKDYLAPGDKIEYIYGQTSDFKLGDNKFILKIKELESGKESTFSFDFIIKELDSMGVDIEALSCKIEKDKYSVVMKNNGPSDIKRGCISFDFDRADQNVGMGYYRCFGKNDFWIANFFGEDSFITKLFKRVDIFSKGERIKFSVKLKEFGSTPFDNLPSGEYKIKCGYDRLNSLKGLYDDKNESNDFIETVMKIK